MTNEFARDEPKRLVPYYFIGFALFVGSIWLYAAEVKYWWVSLSISFYLVIRFHGLMISTMLRVSAEDAVQGFAKIEKQMETIEERLDKIEYNIKSLHEQ